MDIYEKLKKKMQDGLHLRGNEQEFIRVYEELHENGYVVSNNEFIVGAVFEKLKSKMPTLYPMGDGVLFSLKVLDEEDIPFLKQEKDALKKEMDDIDTLIVNIQKKEASLNESDND